METYNNRMVIKIGTSSLTNENGECNLSSFERLTKVISNLQDKGFEVILVSSGAIAVGANKLNMPERPKSIKEKQAAAAVGQSSIMNIYDNFFTNYKKIIAQILLNDDDIKHNTKKENLINTFNTLLEMKAIPIVNENDSVGYNEIENHDRLFSDNDMLSALVAVLCKAKKLIILSDIDGMYDSDPRTNEKARLIEKIEKIDEDIYTHAGGAGSRRGTGGMKTKINAASLATENGIDVIITNGNSPENIYDIIEGNSIGTLFVGHN